MDSLTLELLEASEGIVREMKRLKRNGIVKMLENDFYDLECAVTRAKREHDSYMCNTPNCPACQQESACEGIRLR